MNKDDLLTYDVLNGKISINMNNVKTNEAKDKVIDMVKAILSGVNSEE